MIKIVNSIHDSNCKQFQHQPLKVSWTNTEGKLKSYTLDSMFLFSDIEKRFLVEIKEDEEYFEIKDNPDTLLKWDLT